MKKTVFIMICLSLALLGCSFNNKKEKIAYSLDDKQFWANKFEIKEIGGGMPAGPQRTSFLEFDNPWYKMQVQPISNYYAVYLDNEIYNAIVDALISNYNVFKVTEDNITYFYDPMVGIKMPCIKTKDLIKVDGLMAETYFLIYNNKLVFNVNGESGFFQDLMNYLGKKITISDDNFEIVEATKLSDLPIHYNNSYTAIAYFYYQEFTYTYNYKTEKAVNETIPFFGSMAVTNDEIIHHNLLDENKIYLTMDVPLVLNFACTPLNELKYNTSGKKEFIAFEIYEYNNQEYIVLSDNADISTITLRSQADNYDVLFSDKIIADKTYYSVSELLSKSKKIQADFSKISEYNSDVLWSAYHKAQNEINDSIINCFKVQTQYDKYIKPETSSYITSGDVIFETTNEVSDIDATKRSNSSEFGRTIIQFGSHEVTISVGFSDWDTNYGDLIYLEWVKSGDKNQLVIRYDESLIGEAVKVYYGYPPQKYHYQYVSYYGATIDAYTNWQLSNYLFINLS